MSVSVRLEVVESLGFPASQLEVAEIAVFVRQIDNEPLSVKAGDLVIKGKNNEVFFPGDESWMFDGDKVIVRHLRDGERYIIERAKSCEE